MGVIKFKDPVTGKWVQANGSPFPITVTLNGDQASHTSGQIYAHVQAGGMAVLLHEDFYYELRGCCADYATFDLSSDDGMYYTYMVYGDGAFDYFEYQAVTTEEFNKKITIPTTAEVGQTIVVKSVDSNGKPTKWEAADLPSGGGSSGIVVAKFDGQTMAEIFCSSHTHEELFEYLFSGIPVIAHVSIVDQVQNMEQKYITCNCWLNTGGYVYVGDYFYDTGWLYSGDGNLWTEF